MGQLVYLSHGPLSRLYYWFCYALTDLALYDLIEGELDSVLPFWASHPLTIVHYSILEFTIDTAFPWLNPHRFQVQELFQTVVKQFFWLTGVNK